MDRSLSHPNIPWHPTPPLQAVAKYLQRECDAAAARVRAHLQRKRRGSATAALEYRWTGAVRHGPQALGALDAHVAEAVASSRTLTLNLTTDPNPNS